MAGYGAHDVHELTSSLLMLAALAVAPWLAHATADRAVSRFQANPDAPDGAPNAETRVD